MMSCSNSNKTSSTSSAAHHSPPRIIRAQVQCNNNNNKLGLRIKRSDQHNGSVVIYHVDPGSFAAEHTELSVGCEILGVNDHRIPGGSSAGRVLDTMLHYAQKHGKVDILATSGDRPRGSLYVVAKNTAIKNGSSDASTAQSGMNDILSRGPTNGSNNILDGLELEETSDGRVRVVSNDSRGLFAGLRLNKGDCIFSVDGTPVSCIDEVRGALLGSAGRGHKLVPILTYNVFRRLKTTVMTAVCSSMLRAGGREGTTAVGRPVNIEDTYNVQEKLGEGAFAVVKKATHKITGQQYAIKIVNRSSLNKDMEVALKDEITILKELKHEHIMQLDNVVVTINHYYLVAEYLEGGELFDRIVDKSAYTESEARDVCTILFTALAYCHARGIAHRDLKPENLLLQNRQSDSEIKIADFGFAKEAKDDRSLSTMCGTPGYVAPEILRKEKYGTKADMWSMGVIVFILMGGYPPFYADSPRKLIKLTKAGKYEFDPEYWGEISTGAKDMISSLLVTEPDKRASAEDILKHPWMREDRHKLVCMSLAKTQVELRKYIARMRFKKAIHSILFVNTFTGENAVFSGTNKRRCIRALEEACTD